MTINWEPRWITDLSEDEVFVFGSNDGGLHGGGAAGYAHRKGWAEWGVAEGLQWGDNGMSYGIPTIVSPGRLRSTPMNRILRSVKKFLQFARAHADYTFFMTGIGEVLAGYTPAEMKEAIWDRVEHLVPNNVKFVRPLT